MAVALRAGSTLRTFAAPTSSTTTVLTAPSTISDGDTLIIWFLTYVAAGGTPTATPPAGFSLIPVSPALPLTLTSGTGAVMYGYGWYKVASGESGNYTVTHNSTTPDDTAGWMASYSGADTSTPVTITGTSGESNASSTWSTLGVTTTIDGSMVVFAALDWADNTNTYTAPAATPPTFTGVQTTTNTNMYVAEGVMTTHGATGSPVTATADSAGSDPSGCILFVINAPGAATQNWEPNSDIAATGWTPSTGATLWQVWDDQSDSTYATATPS